jgi:hypothetical protein
MSFKNILLGTQRKNYTHDLSFDNNTTMDFGVLQPLLSQYMLPKSHIKVNSKQLVRLAPMPTPSFARMYLSNFASFVKMTDVVPYHECLLAKLPFSVGGHTYLPTSLPYTNNKTLMYFLMQDAFVDYYYVPAGTPSAQNKDYTRVTSADTVNTIISAFITAFLPTTATTQSSVLHPHFNWIQKPKNGVSVPPSITPFSADYTLAFGDDAKYLICFKFSQAGLRLRKILLGLGFSLTFDDVSKLSLAPLLAFYKAYYDRFGLTRDLPFETTNCFSIIKIIENYSVDYTLENLQSNVTFVNFIHKELSECWYTTANSYIAAHRSSLTNGITSRTLDQPLSQFGESTVLPNDSEVSYPYTSLYSPGVNSYSFTQLSLDLLKRLSTFVNKDSVIGKRLSDWVRVHYGADVSNSLFEDSNRINEWRTNIDIDDVFSTSDTADIGKDKKGDYLGAYAGKGTGFSQSGFTFRAPVHGFVFVMSCVVPLANTFQGNDPTLLAIDLDTIPQPEFDALGFEATPRNVFIGDNGVYSSAAPTPKSADTFGFVPRYTGFKTKKNIVNGDMYKGYYQTDLLPYFNDRLLYNNEADCKILVSDESTGAVTKLHFDITNNHVPNASTEFQKICRYAFMGDYDRLFYNDTSEFSSVDSSSYPRDDNFIVQSVFDVKVSNFLKPVQNSYDTIDEDVDNNTTPVSTI